MLSNEQNARRYLLNTSISMASKWFIANNSQNKILILANDPRSRANTFPSVHRASPFLSNVQTSLTTSRQTWEHVHCPFRQNSLFVQFVKVLTCFANGKSMVAPSVFGTYGFEGFILVLSAYGDAKKKVCFTLVFEYFLL